MTLFWQRPPDFAPGTRVRNISEHFDQPRAARELGQPRPGWPGLRSWYLAAVLPGGLVGAAAEARGDLAVPRNFMDRAALEYEDRAVQGADQG